MTMLSVLTEEQKKHQEFMFVPLDRLFKAAFSLDHEQATALLNFCLDVITDVLEVDNKTYLRSLYTIGAVPEATWTVELLDKAKARLEYLTRILNSPKMTGEFFEAADAALKRVVAVNASFQPAGSAYQADSLFT